MKINVINGHNLATISLNKIFQKKKNSLKKYVHVKLDCNPFDMGVFSESLKPQVAKQILTPQNDERKIFITDKQIFFTQNDFICFVVVLVFNSFD